LHTVARYFLVVALTLAHVVVLDVNAAWEEPEILISQVTTLQQKFNIPALAIVLMDNNQVLYSGAFALSATSQQIMSEHTPFRVGSITKTFTALTLLRLANAGKITLDDPVKPLMPPGSFVNSWEDQSPLRAIHLLEHTSGLSDLSAPEFGSNAVLSLQEALAVNPAARATHWPPGTRHSYSNVNPGLSSLLIEHASGQSFEIEATRLLRDMGMPRAGFTEADAPSLPGGFKADGVSAIPYWNMSFRAFGALNVSAVEMQALLFFLLNNGKNRLGETLLTSAYFEQLFTPRTSLAARAGLTLGYGAGLYGWIKNGQILYGHGGDADGYLSRYGIHRESGRGYFFVINTDNPKANRELRNLVENALTQRLEVQTGQTVKLDATKAEQYTGSYYPSTTRFGVQQWLAGEKQHAQIRLQKGELVFLNRGRKTNLVPVGSGLFRRKDDPIASIAFVKGQDDKLYLQGELGEFVRTSP
jgi:CubicO group peptidase (beta-lactamase class C family)